MSNMSIKTWSAFIVLCLSAALVYGGMTSRQQMKDAFSVLTHVFEVSPVVLPEIPIPEYREQALLPSLSGKLFGATPQQVKKVTKQVKKQVKKQVIPTGLNLTLNGTFPSSQPSQAMAAITIDRNEETLFRVGDTVLNDMKLVEVYSDHVILEGLKTKEELRFTSDNPDVLALFIATQNGPQLSDEVIPSQQKNNFSKVRLEEYAAAFRATPQDILKKMGLSEMSRAYQVEDESPLTFAGFQSGDQIVSINGQPIKALLMNSNAMLAVISLGKARVDVVRAQKRVSLRYTFE
ncbi:type II secretion system protein N [Marinomonas sp. THO17]|uniref:type II secretion system protein N n=1 Tax=Marinomonas sp. THO17 TaxID=3149048 RepID=UPI00336BFAEE